MIGYLRSTHRFVERLKIGPEENTLKPFKESDDLTLPLIGCFAYISQVRVLFYRWEDILRLRLGDNSPFILKDTTARWISDGTTVNFRLRKDRQSLIDTTYPLDENIKNLSDDLTPMVEAEHFDILLLVSNTLSDAGRFGRIFRA